MDPFSCAIFGIAGLIIQSSLISITIISVITGWYFISVVPHLFSKYCYFFKGYTNCKGCKSCIFYNLYNLFNLYNCKVLSTMY